MLDGQRSSLLANQFRVILPAMGKRRVKELGPMPKTVRTAIVVLGLVFIGLVLVASKFYLPNWRGDTVFLPVALLIAILLIAAVIVQLLRKS